MRRGGALISKAPIGRSGSVSTAKLLQLPGIEVHIVATVVFISPNIKGYLYLVIGIESVSQGSFLLNTLKFDHLRIVSIRHFHDEFPLRESAREGLNFIHNFEGAFQFEIFSHRSYWGGALVHPVSTETKAEISLSSRRPGS